MEKRYDVVALGELLVDFTMGGISQQGNLIYEACPGGAPCNVLAMLSKLGKQTGFVGKVGKDMFGTMLKNTLVSSNIDVSYLHMDADVNTTLAFVTTREDGDREFSFYRNPGADMMLQPAEIDEKYIKAAKVFHFGTLSMTHEKVREATKKAINIAKENGLLITFDPNIRPLLWDDLDSPREQMEFGFSQCDVLKIADNEIQFATGLDDYDAGVEQIVDKYNIPMVLLTLGKDGSRAYYKGRKVEVGGFKVNTIETTGAGDTFMGMAIGYILDNGMENLADDQLRELLTKANAAAAIVTTRKGAIKSMPELTEIEDLCGSNCSMDS